MSRTKVLIATPIYGGLVHSEYMMSVRHLEKKLIASGIETEVLHMFGTLIHVLRTTFMNALLIRKDFTHLLFVDADMVFRPIVVEKLLSFGKPVVGCLYPERKLDINKLFQHSKTAENAENAISLSQSFVASHQLHIAKKDGSFQYVIDQGFVRTFEVGCGILLIHRSVPEEMVLKCPDLVLKKRIPDYSTFLGDNDVLLAFEPTMSRDGRPLGEDLSFCSRWIDRCDGEIWALVDEPIGHIGRQTFHGRALDSLLSRSPRPMS